MAFGHLCKMMVMFSSSSKLKLLALASPCRVLSAIVHLCFSLLHDLMNFLYMIYKLVQYEKAHSEVLYYGLPGRNHLSDGFTRLRH
jgi:hypothetical protein